MRALVLGAGGQLGQELLRELAARQVETLGLTRAQLDITDAQAVQQAVEANRTDWIFNCAAYNLVDKAESEPDLAMRVNGLAVRGIAQAAQAAGAVLMHYSTDHVFDGLKIEPYTEEDLPSPPSAYAVSKLAGEHYARLGCEKAYVVRVAGVFGPAGRATNLGNFPERVLGRAERGEPLRIVDDFFSNPTYAVPLAARSIDLIERGPAGLYHIGGGGPEISWYDYARLILDTAGIEADLVATNRNEFQTPAGRPTHAGLSNAKIEALGIAPMPTLEEALHDYMARR